MGPSLHRLIYVGIITGSLLPSPRTLWMQMVTSRRWLLLWNLFIKRGVTKVDREIFKMSVFKINTQRNIFKHFHWGTGTQLVYQSENHTSDFRSCSPLILFLYHLPLKLTNPERVISKEVNHFLNWRPPKVRLHVLSYRCLLMWSYA